MLIIREHDVKFFVSPGGIRNVLLTGSAIWQQLIGKYIAAYESVACQKVESGMVRQHSCTQAALSGHFGGLSKMRKLLAEALGTFVLVASICGTASIAYESVIGPQSILGIAVAAGIPLVAFGYAVGPVSGGHFNPAVTCGLAIAGRFPVKSVVPYTLAQVIGGTLAALSVFFILTYKIGWSPHGFASNGFDKHSPGGFSRTAVIFAEFMLTAIFVFVFCRVTRGKGAGIVLAPLVIGLTFAGLHLVSLPVSHASLNPARSTATAMFAETWALHQLWVFWVAPLAGGLLGGIIDRYVGDVS